MDRDAVVAVENARAKAPVLVICEHASNAFPAPWGDLGLSAEARLAHIAWDPGAEGVARCLAELLDARLVVAKVSRLVYDLNRPPDAESACAARSEIWDIPGNRGLSPEARLARTEAVYLPFHDVVARELAAMLARGQRPAIVTVHSFTPIWHGQQRETELGIIHDADPSLALAVTAAAEAKGGLVTHLNRPYSAADGVTHTLRLHATPYGLPHVMLEIRNDLIASPEAEARMAETLAPILTEAISGLAPGARGAA